MPDPEEPPPTGTPDASRPAAGQTPLQGGPVFADSVAETDTSTSVVIDPSESPRITLGKRELREHRDVVFAAPLDTDAGPVELRMDLIVPEAAGPVPVVVYVPGGGFMFARREGAPELRAYVAEAGFAVASIEYRTIANGATFREALADVRSALGFLREHGAEFGLDAGGCAVWGESAGGYLAAMAGVTGGPPLAAVVDSFGPSDLTGIAADFDAATQAAYSGPDNIAAMFVNGRTSGLPLSGAPAAAAESNPLSYVGSASELPGFLFLHGDADPAVSPSQTLLLHDALRAVGADTTRLVVRGAGHGDLAVLHGRDVGTPWSSEAVMNRIVTFLRRTLCDG
ncbi:alpha/beta hydrolase fold domain-containing protein [Streptomyces olivoreticuli]